MNQQLTLSHGRLRKQVEHLEQRNPSTAGVVYFAHAVLGTSATVLDCDACRAALPDHIEAELNNRPNPEYRRVRQHVDLCPACSEVYLDLLEVALLAEEGLLPSPSVAIDLSFLEPPSERSSSDV